MKQKIYILGLITVLIVFTGLVFKINHFAGAGIILTLGIVIFVLLFLPLALRDHYKAEGDRRNLTLYIVTWITCFLVFTAMLFKIMHWPLAGIMLLITLPFPYVVFLPVFLAVTSKNKNFNIYNTVFVLLLLVISSVFSALLALNVSRDRIDDSYNLSRDYSRIESVLNQLPVATAENKVVQNIDEVLKIVNEYKETILKQEKESVGQWNENPASLMKPDSKGIAAQALLDSGDRPAGTKLLNSLKSLVRSMETTPRYAELAKSAPVIFDMVVPSGKEEDWSSWKFRDNMLSWVLIYLDGLETNLKMIKAIPQ
jgi:hypothetical protein